MADNSLYSITVNNFNKYNSGLKKGHKSTLISNNFCSDSKLGVMPLTVRWLFLGIVLTCGDYTRDTIEMNERQLRELLESSWSVPRALDALQSIQLLSYAKIDVFYNRIEKKVIEEKRIEKNIKEAPQSAALAFDFEKAFKDYPIQKKGPKAEARFKEQIKTESRFNELLVSIENYKKHLAFPSNSWRVPKQTFAAYLGTKASGFFWLDWVNHVEEIKNNPVDQAKEQMRRMLGDYEQT